MARYFQTRRRFLGAAALLLSGIVVFRWWVLVDQLSVNMMFWDQWDFYNAFFKSGNFWDIFSYRHGPHRQGAGFLITKVIADLSGWNTRAEGFAIGTVVFLAMVGALALKKRLLSRMVWVDVAIPLIFLTPMQAEIFTTPNLALAAFPLFLVILYCLASLPSKLAECE